MEVESHYKKNIKNFFHMILISVKEYNDIHLCFVHRDEDYPRLLNPDGIIPPCICVSGSLHYGTHKRD